MADRPIIFSAGMIHALLDGRKSQTRRLLKLAGRRPDYIGPKGCTGDPACWGWDNGDGGYILADRDPSDKFAASWRDFAASYAPGDRLWVREAHAMVPATAYRMSDGVVQTVNPEDSDCACLYRTGFDRSTSGLRWRPSIHMPRWSSRLTLIVTDVRIQRVQDISEADAQAEGLVEVYEGWATDREGRHWGPDARASYRVLWNDLHGEDAWERNDWVAALTFTVHRQNIDQMEPTND